MENAKIQNDCGTLITFLLNSYAIGKLFRIS